MTTGLKKAGLSRLASPAWIWLKTSLLNSPTQIVLSAASLYVLYLIVAFVFRWAVLDAHWAGDSRQDCDGFGACWVFVKVRLPQFLYGFYPESQRWRVNLTLLLCSVTLLPLLAPTLVRKLVWAVVALSLYAIGAFVLLNGGILDLPPVETHLWGGLMLTLVVSGVGILGSLPMGILLALGRRSKLPAIQALCVAFIEVVRGVPLVTLLFMASTMLPFFLPEGASPDKLVRALIGITLFAGANMAEVVRGGLQAIPQGQFEAAAALGLGYWKTMGLVVLPQALRVVIPGILNTFISLFKDTTLVLIIGLFDLLGMVQAAATDPRWLGFALEGYVFAALVFWVFCFGMSRLSMALERRLGSA
jgi:general L-amino acid transport system permease protein